MSSPISARRHPVSRLEGRVRGVVGPRLLAQGWTPRVMPFTGYGQTRRVRLLARVLLTPPGQESAGAPQRGWRRFLSAPAGRVQVRVEIGGVEHVMRSDRDGYVDEMVFGEFAPGWLSARWSVAGRDPVEAPVRVVAPGTTMGVVSDIDDTVIVTMLPRPLV